MSQYHNHKEKEIGRLEEQLKFLYDVFYDEEFKTRCCYELKKRIVNNLIYTQDYYQQLTGHYYNPKRKV